MNQYLYKIQPTRLGMLTEGPTPDEGRLVGEHFAYLEDLVERGIVLLAGRTLNADSRAFGIVVFVAASEEEAQRVVDGDPAVAGGVMTAELFPYRIVLASPRIAAG